MAPTTKLEAINTMLSAIGEAPVTQLNSGLVEADIAETILESVNREVQGQGFHFNRELNVTFNPDSNNNIVLASFILSLISVKDLIWVSRVSSVLSISFIVSSMYS